MDGEERRSANAYTSAEYAVNSSSIRARRSGGFGDDLIGFVTVMLIRPMNVRQRPPSYTDDLSDCAQSPLDVNHVVPPCVVMLVRCLIPPRRDHA